MFSIKFMKNPSICSVSSFIHSSCEPHISTRYIVTLILMSLQYPPQCGITRSVW